MAISDAVERMGNAADLDTLDTVFQAALREEGVDWYAYVRSFDPVNPDMSMNDYRLGNFPDIWTERYVELGYDADDPVRLFAFRTPQPFTWAEAQNQIAQERQTPPILEEAANVGLSAGGTIAIFGPCGRFYSVSFGAKTPGADTEWQMHRLGLLAHQLHLSYERIKGPEPAMRHSLSAKEQEVLHWCARGKSNADIGDIMGISNNTVDYHIRRIYRKLGVNARTPAALMGVMTGAIQP